MLVSVDRGETRVALLEGTGTVSPTRKSATTTAAAGRPRRRRKTANPAAGYQVAELYLERRGARSIVGNIYKGRVDNVLAGLEAAFVDIGLEKNGFLHVDEIVLPGVETVRRGRGSGREGRQITDMLKPGQEIVVQVVKDPLKTKGARLSMDLTIAGRYMVYAPYGEGVGVSRRLDEKERERLRKEAAKLDLKGGGAIIRTAAQGAKRAELEREMMYLFKLGEVLQKRVAESPAPSLVFQEADLSVRVVRDIYSDAFERAIVDDPKQHHRLVSFFSRTAPDLVEHVELWDDEKPLFEAFGVEDVLASTLNRRVDLPSGGYLMIDYAEALTVIDVNSGSFIGRGKSARLEDTITKTNLEAADEVVRQLRLRDIGGIIVIDFIDMARARNRDAVLKTLRKALDEDRTKTFVVEISPLGLVEMTRQNVTEGVREIMTRPCPTCHGEGVIKSEETIAIEFERRMRDLAAETKAEAILLQMNPRVSAEFTGNDARALHAIEAETGKWFHFEGSEGLPLDHFAVLMESDREQVLERALPFREGEEVHLELIEPHMYNPGDAVAKIDGYIIAVRDADRFVGEKRLVRIEEVGRTSATARLVEVPVSADADSGRAPKPKPRPPARRAPRPRATAAVAADGDGDETDGMAAGETDNVAGELAAHELASPSAALDDRAEGDALGADIGEDGDDVESKSRRRGRRGGRRRSGARAETAAGTPSSE
ncbi:MAG TPA: Rne/Rng family ribonuclease [Solirubrobacteraceae bacterium]|nr:Rne/Rng family ribonuclease [Solirubrobacteraceae bacterium]